MRTALVWAFLVSAGLCAGSAYTQTPPPTPRPHQDAIDAIDPFKSSGQPPTESPSPTPPGNVFGPPGEAGNRDAEGLLTGPGAQAVDKPPAYKPRPPTVVTQRSFDQLRAYFKNTSEELQDNAEGMQVAIRRCDRLLFERMRDAALESIDADMSLISTGDVAGPRAEEYKALREQLRLAYTEQMYDFRRVSFPLNCGEPQPKDAVRVATPQPKMAPNVVPGPAGKTATTAPGSNPTERLDPTFPGQRTSMAPCPVGPLAKPIIVGTNGKVGNTARMLSGVKQQVLSRVGGGGMGDMPIGVRTPGGPRTMRCRVKDSEMTVFKDPATGTAIKMAAQNGKDGLTVYSKIESSPDTGTFQAALLERPDGAVLAPADIGICDMWGEWTLTVNWTKSTYVDNQLVKRETGGWQEKGRFSFPGFASSDQAPDGIWSRLGFSNASKGARMVAMTFKTSPADLAKPQDFYLHVTRPGLNPVTTTPFAMRMGGVADGLKFTQTPCQTTLAAS